MPHYGARYEVVDPKLLQPLLEEPDTPKRIPQTARGRILSRYMQGDVATYRDLVRNLVKIPPNPAAPFEEPFYGRLVIGAYNGEFFNLELSIDGTTEGFVPRVVNDTPLNFQSCSLRTVKPGIERDYWCGLDPSTRVRAFEDVGLSFDEMNAMHERFLVRLWRAAFPENPIYALAARSGLKDGATRENEDEEDVTTRTSGSKKKGATVKRKAVTTVAPGSKKKGATVKGKGVATDVAVKAHKRICGEVRDDACQAYGYDDEDDEEDLPGLAQAVNLPASKHVRKVISKPARTLDNNSMAAPVQQSHFGVVETQDFDREEDRRHRRKIEILKTREAKLAAAEERLLLEEQLAEKELAARRKKTHPTPTLKVEAVMKTEE